MSPESRFILKQMWEENLGTQASVHLIAGVCLVWGLLNTGSRLVMLLERPSIDHYAFCESAIVLVYMYDRDISIGFKCSQCILPKTCSLTLYYPRMTFRFYSV